MSNIPIEEYIEHLQTLNLEGTIKWLLDKVEALEKEIKTWDRMFKDHMKAHQAVYEAREAGKCKK